MLPIEICDEQIQEIVIKELYEKIRYLKEDYEDGKVGVFSFDWDEERKKVKRLIKALARVLDWYEVRAMTKTTAELIQAGQDAVESAMRAAEARQYGPIPNPFTAPASYEVDAQVLVYCGDTKSPVVTLPFWSAHVNGDVRERVREVAKQMAAAYADATEWDVTVQVIINHRMIAL